MLPATNAAQTTTMKTITIHKFTTMITLPASSATLVSPEPCHHQKLDFNIATKPKGHLKLHVSNLPRRRVAKRRAILEKSESNSMGSGKTHSAHSTKVGEEPQCQHVSIQPLGEETDVFVSLEDVEDWNGVKICIEDEGENDQGIPTLSRSVLDLMMATMSGKVLIVGRVNAFTVVLGIISRRCRRDVTKTYMELHDMGRLEDSWRGLLSRKGLGWIVGQQE
ncbi:uncharacterized protein EV420DRAFT_1678122 [Desarmillaria tabescens]|uniref:Uncharacterized protein n=1 Tax=Armillaria tabescens TaxID=1929756 RepID=A0AA39KDZ3_ARMTA|nr:uncharacterized protein EV420DRAFT_1678122 [Desarmillaria tabescens]KAK0459404.1 hypothetical protein EV420DRAFT_1678122 [Desarmillaria tabescens]